MSENREWIEEARRCADEMDGVEDRVAEVLREVAGRLEKLLDEKEQEKR